MGDTFDLIAAERRASADVFETLTDEQWTAPSLCDGWTTRAVAAHLVMPFLVSTPKLILGMMRFRGNFDRLSGDFALRTAASHSGKELAGILRANAQHRFTPPTLGPEAPLTDIVVHTLDIRTPLGLGPGQPAPEALATILAFLVTPKAARGFVPKARIAGLHFEATDVDWAHGDGPAVRGPATAVVQALAGRPAGLDALEGDGVEPLRARLAGG
jgi:uncharacterized protein (TIGR03083 family)